MPGRSDPPEAYSTVRHPARGPSAWVVEVGVDGEGETGERPRSVSSEGAMSGEVARW